MFWIILHDENLKPTIPENPNILKPLEQPAIYKSYRRVCVLIESATRNINSESFLKETSINWHKKPHLLHPILSPPLQRDVKEWTNEDQNSHICDGKPSTWVLYNISPFFTPSIIMLHLWTDVCATSSINKINILNIMSTQNLRIKWNQTTLMNLIRWRNLPTYTRSISTEISVSQVLWGIG